MNKIKGIYKITNLINGKCYIGKSEDIEHRKKVHYKELKNNTHHSKHLQDDYNHYGEENFNFEIMETINDSDLLLISERFYIDKFDSFNKGYNMTYPKLQHDNSQNTFQNRIDIIKTLINQNCKFIFVSDDLRVDIEGGIAPSVIYESFEILVKYIKYLKIFFFELKCTIKYKKSKSKPKQRITVDIEYFENMSISYSLNKNIKLLCQGYSYGFIHSSDDIAKNIMNKKLIDIQKPIVFWK